MVMSFVKRVKRISLLQGLLLFLFVMFTLSGCGGGKLIPRELKDYLSYSLKTPRRNVEVDQAFQTTITLRIEQMNQVDAQQAMMDLIEKSVEYFRRDKITDFLQEKIVFHIRINSDADQYIKWTTSASLLRDLVEEKMSEVDFYELCTRDENW